MRFVRKIAICLAQRKRTAPPGRGRVRRERAGEGVGALVAVALLVGCFGLFGLVFDPGERVALPVVHLAQQNGVALDYRGLYADHPRVVAFRERIAASRREAILHAQLVLGVKFAFPEEVVVRLSDSLGPPEVVATSERVLTVDGKIHLISLSAEKIAAGLLDMDAALVHESIHSLMKDAMGLQEYFALPGWIRESLAVWGASQLDECALQRLFHAHQQNRSIPSILDDLGSLDEPADDYLVAALAFEYVLENHGWAALRTLFADLLARSSPADAFRHATGLTIGDLGTRSLAFSGMYFENLLLAQGLSQYEDAIRLADRGEICPAWELLQSMVKTKPTSVLYPDAQLLLQRWGLSRERLSCQPALAEADLVERREITRPAPNPSGWAQLAFRD